MATEQGNPEIVDMLLNAHAEVNMENYGKYGGETPLYNAIRQNHVEIVQKLIDAGAVLLVPDGKMLGGWLCIQVGGDGESTFVRRQIQYFQQVTDVRSL